MAQGDNQVETRKNPPLAGFRFLIIEDEIMQAWEVSAIVSDLGGSVEKVAYRFEQAKDALSQGQFDCAIVDLNLDGLYAYPIVEALAQRGIPCVFCTAYAESEAIFIGIDHIPRVKKPVDPAELCAAVLSVLRRD
jgi:DNA-binding response OmpR family regulator